MPRYVRVDRGSGEEEIRAAPASPKRDNAKLPLMTTYPVLAFVERTGDLRNRKQVEEVDLVFWIVSVKTFRTREKAAYRLADLRVVEIHDQRRDFRARRARR
jgi:hypothetical protein